MTITNLASFLFSQIRSAEEERDRVYEPVIGIVTDNKDPEKLLRVKVKLPVLSMQDTTWWVPVVSLGAGKDRGWFFLPEVNDEVLVVFEHGDMNHPLVIGTLWNGKDKAPETNPGSNPKRCLVSRAGSRIELDDEKNTITIQDGGGKGVLTFKADDNKLIIEAKQGEVMIQAPAGEVKIFAEGGIDLQATLNLDFRGGKKLNLTGDGGVTIKASGMLALSGGQTEINEGAPKAAECQGEVSEVSDPVGGGGGAGGGGGGATPGSASSGAAAGGGSGGAGAAAKPARVLKQLTRDGVAAAPTAGGAASAGLLASPDDDATKDPLITSVKWGDAEVAWGAPRVLTAPRKKGGAKPKVKVTAIARNVGATVTVKIVDAESGATVASGSASVVNESVSWDFIPADAKLTECSDVRAVVEGSGKKAESPDTLHVHQPYWVDAASNGLSYGVKWPEGGKFPKGSTHVWEDIESITVDDVGRTNLDAWADRLTMYMRKHLGLAADSPSLNDPRCRFYVRDLQADLGAISSLYDTEATLTGGAFSPGADPSGVLGPLTFLGLFLLQRLAMYPGGDNAGASRDGEPATLAKEEKLALLSAKKKPRPRVVDDEIAKLLSAWVAGRLKVRVDASDYQQVPFKYHGRSNGKKASTKRVQRRVARRYQMWILAVELLGGWLPDAGERRDWSWPIWRKYANGRSAVSNHQPGLAADFNTDDGGVVPYSLFVVVKDPDKATRFQLWNNLDVVRRLKGSTDYGKQPEDHLTAADRDKVRTAATSLEETRDELTASLKKDHFGSQMKKHAKTVSGAIGKNTKEAKAAMVKIEKAFKPLFKGLDAKEKLAKLQQLAQGNGSQADLTTYEGQKKNLQTFLVAGARNRVLAVEHERFSMLHEFATGDDAKRTKVLEELRASVDDLKQRSQGAVLETAPPYDYKYGRAKRGIPDGVTLPVDQLPGAAERGVLGSELAARKKVLAALENATINGDAIELPLKGDFLRIDRIAEETCEVYRIDRHAKGEWEWWHFQYFNPDEKDQHLKSDALFVEMARELGPTKVVDMLHLEEVEGADKDAKDLGAKGLADLAAKYEWWREKHPSEFDEATKTHATGVTLAELTKPTA